MKVTAHSTLVRVSLSLTALGVIGFAYGVIQTIRQPGEAVAIPLPSAQSRIVNLDAVPKAAPLDAAAANAAVDPAMAKLKLRKSVDQAEADRDEEPEALPAEREAQASTMPSQPPAQPAPAPNPTAAAPHGPY